MPANIPAGDSSLLVEFLTENSKVLQERERELIIESCERVIASLRTPIETARKLAFLELDHAVTRTALELNVFSLLAASDENDSSAAVSTNDLAGRITPSCRPSLLARLLRYMAQPLSLIVEEGSDQWRISASGRVLAQEGFSAGCKLYFDSCGPAFRMLPTWVSRWSNPTTKAAPSTAFKAGSPQEDIEFFAWLQRDAAALQDFHAWMDTLAQFQYSSQQKIDFGEWISTDIQSEEIAFIDVGGGSGSQCLALLRKRGRHTPGRVVNQDRAEVVAENEARLKKDGIETSTHDFFEEQPMRGAHIYHFRQILHDWPDEDCIRILERIQRAMTPCSTLLIDEVVMPERGAHWMITQRDLTMMALFNAGERTEQQWRFLFVQAGLVLEEIRTYDERMAACILVAKLPKEDC